MKAVCVLILGAQLVTMTGCGGGGGGGSGVVAGPTVGTVTGRARSAANGQPIPNFTATTDTNQMTVVVNSTTGTFMISDVLPGTRAVTISAQAFVTATSAPRNVTAGAATDFGDVNLSRNVPMPPEPPAL